MRHLALLLPLALAAPDAQALSSEARQFMEISKQLEPVQCEKRKLRREIAVAEVERREGDIKALRDKFAALDRNPNTAKLERRLAELQPRVSKSADPEDLRAISLQQREAFYRCE